MPRNGSGVYSLPAAGTVTTGTTISSTDYNATTADIESALNDVNAESVDINGGAIDGVTLGTNSAVTEAQIDNLNADGNTISSTNSNGDINITPNGTGSVVVSKVDIAAGEIDGTAIGGNSASSGAFTTLLASGATVLSGAFTSIGIDDNATAETVQIDDNNITLGQAGAGHTMRHAAADQLRIMSGGTAGAMGGNLVQYGESHASLADDTLLRRSGTNVAHVDGATGDVTIYEDDGTTAGLTFDASAGDFTISGDVAAANITAGTFDPLFEPTSGSFTSVTYESNTTFYFGEWDRVDDLVTFNLRIRTDGITVGAGTGLRVVLDTLPTSTKGAAVTVGFAGDWGTQPAHARVVQGTNEIQLYSAAFATIDEGDFVAGTDKHELILSGSYKV